jgi:hypothetical protein
VEEEFAEQFDQEDADESASSKRQERLTVGE